MLAIFVERVYNILEKCEKAAAKRVFSRLTTNHFCRCLAIISMLTTATDARLTAKWRLITNIKITIRKTRGLNSDNKANDNSTRQC